MQRLASALVAFGLPRALALLLLLVLAVPATTLASPYVPRKARAKVDKVDVEDAPLIRIHTTFLDGKGLPVSPEKIRGADVYCNDQSLGVTDQIRTFGDLEEPMDLALVLPMTRRLPVEVREQMKEGLGEIVGQLRKIDRVAAFVDDGVGVQQAKLKSGDAANLIAAVEPQGSGAFLYSSLEQAIDEMIANGNKESRRAIILVTDGFDIETLTPGKVRARIMSLYSRAREANVMIFVIMYKPIITDLVPFFEGMSRKTRATYRQTSTASGVLRNVKYTFGEIYGQLVVEYEHETAEEGDACEFAVAFEREFGGTVHTRNFSRVTIESLKTDWWGIAIIAAIILGSLILLLIVFLVVRKILRKRRARREQEEGALVVDAEGEVGEQAPIVVPRPQFCGQCRRSLAPNWTHCLFCGWDIQAAMAAAAAAIAGGGAAAATGGGGPAKKKGGGGGGAPGKSAGGAKKASGGGGGGGGSAKKTTGGSGGGDSKKGSGGGDKKQKKQDDAPKTCPSCGRAQMPEWNECLFCKAGIGGGASGSR